MEEHKLSVGQYDILINHDWQELLRFIEHLQPSKIGVLVDDNTERDCWPILSALNHSQNWTLIRIPPGEVHKNLDTCQFIWTRMMELGFDRHSLLLNLGGGVIGDMGGFCAATFKRGIPFIQIPTTLLSQVDASIGGKLGIDFADLKNSIGLFRDPELVFIHTGFLATLPARELRSGFSEMIKHALIAEQSLWATLQQLEDLQQVNWSELLPGALAVKRRVVESDPFEKGLRKILNFGHTIGHAIESYLLQGKDPALHGEAIAAGMICESWLSCELGLLNEAQLQEIRQYIDRIYPKLDLSAEVLPELIQYMQQDKKNQGGHIQFALLEGIGSAAYDQVVEQEDILKSLHYYLEHS
jgi:3-dehydroquinate synthase